MRTTSSHSIHPIIKIFPQIIYLRLRNDLGALWSATSKGNKKWSIIFEPHVNIWSSKEFESISPVNDMTLSKAEMLGEINYLLECGYFVEVIKIMRYTMGQLPPPFCFIHTAHPYLESVCLLDFYGDRIASMTNRQWNEFSLRFALPHERRILIMLETSPGVLSEHDFDRVGL